MKSYRLFSINDEKGVNEFLAEQDMKMRGTTINFLDNGTKLGFLIEDNPRLIEEQTELEGARKNLVNQIAATTRRHDFFRQKQVRDDILPKGDPMKLTPEDRTNLDRIVWNSENSLEKSKADLKKVDEQIADLMERAKIHPEASA